MELEALRLTAIQFAQDLLNSVVRCNRLELELKQATERAAAAESLAYTPKEEETAK